jgi:hypothetical protein
MDIIEHCLALSPVPGLATAFSVFRFIWLTIDQVQVCKQQLIALVHSTAQLLQALDTQFRGGHLSESKASAPLANLIKLVTTALFDSMALITEKFAARSLAIRPSSGYTGLPEINLYKGSAYRPGGHIPSKDRRRC